jgi:transcriptional regulator with XRE-family HTH domain
MSDTSHRSGGAAGSQVRRRELAGFLRSRRERVSPEQVGITHSGRRRTPGLRREEVAQLAGVGVTWYTWLEQGRDIHASDQVLAAVADTLHLDPYERAHLFTLAGAPVPPIERDSKAISPGIRSILTQLEPMPTMVTNARYDILACNRTYDRLVGGLDHLPFEDRNCGLLTFTSPQWRARHVDWEDTARRTVAQLRAGMATHITEPSWKTLIKRLRHESAEFAQLWQEHDVQAPENLTKNHLHPEVGLLRLEFTHLWYSQRSEIRMTIYVPADEQTWQRVRALHELATAVAPAVP